MVLPNLSQLFTFGPNFESRPDLNAELDRWYCYEYMVRANTPGQRDGRIAFWLDGKLLADFPNLRLRDVDTLKIDRFGLSFHIGSNAAGATKKWYDNVVAASSYTPGPFSDRKPSTGRHFTGWRWAFAAIGSSSCMAPSSRAMLSLRRGEAPWMVRPTPATRPSGPFFSTNGEPMRNLLCRLFPLTLGCGLVACGSSGSQDVFNGSGSSGTGGATGGGGDPTTASTTGAGAGTGGSGTGAGSTTGGGTTGAGGGTGGAGGGVRDAGGTGGATVGGPSVSVVQHHNNLSRDGVYVDARLTRAAATTLHVDTTFGNTAIMGPVYAQPLYLVGTGGAPDVVLVATAQNRVYSLNANTGAGIWNVQYGTPVTAGLCGRPLNPLGITGTPVIDAASRTMYFDAMTTVANNARHMIHAVDIDGMGAERTGWPIDVNATATSGAIAFDSPVQNQRAALTLLGGKVFVPFGGHIGDCLGYHGWLVGVTTTGTPQVSAWATTAFAGGIWGSSGPASDGTSIFATTGNTKLAANSGGSGTSPTSWGGGEAVIKFPTSLVQPPLTQVTDYYIPAGWANLDITDADLGGTGAILFDVPGATPSKLVMALGKDRRAHLLNQASLGGMDAQPLAGLTVANGNIIQAAVAYTTALGTYVVFKGAAAAGVCPAGQTGGLTAIKVSAASPPALSIAWCAGVAAQSSPAVSMTTAQGANAILWFVGTDGRLHGIDGDTGANVVADTTALGTVVAHQTPIITSGRIFVASNTRVFAFTP